MKKSDPNITSGSMMDKNNATFIFKSAVVVALACCLGLLFARYGLRNSVPASDGALSDMVLQMAPQRAFSDAVLDAGGRALWNPFVGLGNDEMTTVWYYPYYPTTHLTRIFGLAPGMSLELFLHMALAFFGMFYFLKKIGVGFFAACFGAVAFCTSGMFTAYFFAPLLPLSAAYLPWLFLALERLIDKPDRLDAGIFGLVLGLHLLVGMVQYTVYFAVLLFPYALFRLFQVKKAGAALISPIGNILSGCAVGIVIGTGKLLPWAVNAHRMRGGYDNWASFAQGLFGPKALLTAVYPGIITSTDQIAARSYLGILPMAAAILGVILCFKKPRVRFFLVTAASCAMLTTANPLVNLAWKWIPLFSSFTPIRLWLVGVFALCTLAAFGFDKGAAKWFSSPGKKALVVCFALLSGVFVFWQTNPAIHLDKAYEQTAITQVLKGQSGRLLRVGDPYGFVNGKRIYEAQALLVDRAPDLNCFTVMPDANLMGAVMEKIGKPRDGFPPYFLRTRIMPVENLLGADTEFLDRLHIRFLLSKKPVEGATIVAKDGELILSDRGENFFPLNIYPKPDKNPVTASSWRTDYNGLVAAVDLPVDSVVELSQSFVAGWRAEIDGLPTPVFSEDGLGVKVYVPKGIHSVSFDFHAPYALIADKVTLTGYLLALYLMVLGFATRKKEKADAL